MTATVCTSTWASVSQYSFHVAGRGKKEGLLKRSDLNQLEQKHEVFAPELHKGHGSRDILMFYEPTKSV